MKGLLFVCMVISLCGLLLLAGCAEEVSQIEFESSLPLVTLSPTQATVLQLPTKTVAAITTSTAEPEPISTQTNQPSVTAIATETPTMPVIFEPNAAVSPIVCSQFKSYINIQQETDNESWRLMDFVFEYEDALTFLMWSDRPYPGPTPTPFVGLLEGGSVPPGELSRSSRRLLKGQTWDFNNGTLVESLVTEQSAIQNPCDQNCPLEVVGIAPDNNWQLLQITDAPEDYQGLWLVNNETAITLIPYVPSNSEWQWSSDSDLLWLTYTLQDKSGESYGSESMVVDLTAPDSPQIIFKSWDRNEYHLQSPPNLLSPDDYNLVFSPIDKTMLLYEQIGSSSRIPLDNLSDVYVMDVTQNPMRLLNTYEAHYPFLIDWSDALQDFIMLELSATGAVIYTLNNDVVYEIPMEVLKQMPDVLATDSQFRTDFSDEVDIISLNLNLKRAAISPDVEHVVLMTSNRAWAFSCSD